MIAMVVLTPLIIHESFQIRHRQGLGEAERLHLVLQHRNTFRECATLTFDLIAKSFALLIWRRHDCASCANTCLCYQEMPNVPKLTKAGVLEVRPIDLSLFTRAFLTGGNLCDS